MVVVQGKAVLFKPAVDRVADFYTEKFRKSGRWQYPETMGNGKASDFALTYVNPRLGRARAIMLHPVVFARYKIEETKLMRNKEEAVKAETFEWLQATLSEPERVEAREIGHVHSVKLVKRLQIGGESLFNTVTGGALVFALSSIMAGLYYGAITGTIGGIAIGLITFSKIAIENYINNKHQSNAASEAKS